MNARMSVRVFVCQCDIRTCVSAYVSAEEYTDVSAYVCSHVSAYFCVRILHRIINKIVSLFARAIFRNFTRNHGCVLSHQQSNSLHTFCSSSVPPPPLSTMSHLCMNHSTTTPTLIIHILPSLSPPPHLIASFSTPTSRQIAGM